MQMQLLYNVKRMRYSGRHRSHMYVDSRISSSVCNVVSFVKPYNILTACLGFTGLICLTALDYLHNIQFMAYLVERKARQLIIFVLIGIFASAFASSTCSSGAKNIQ